MQNEESQTKMDRLKNYKFGFELPDGHRVETNLIDEIRIFENDELNKILDESENNSRRFVWKLTEAIKQKSFSYIRHNPGLEMDDQMNDEVFEGAKDFQEKRPK
jgi:hypothetical protein